MRENKKQAALDYIKSIHVEYDSDPVIAYCAFGAGAEWMQNTMIEKACEYAEARYDLECCGNVRDILNYLKSLTEE